MSSSSPTTMQGDEESCNTELCLGLNIGESKAGSSKNKRKDLDQNDDNYSRKKLKLTKDQTALLENNFQRHATLNLEQKSALAEALNLQPRQVEVWFQNKRARNKQKKTEAESEFLEKCCKNLRQQNEILIKEVQRLRALKQVPVPSAKLYTHFLPEAPQSLNICAACGTKNLHIREVKPATNTDVVSQSIKKELSSDGGIFQRYMGFFTESNSVRYLRHGLHVSVKSLVDI